MRLQTLDPPTRALLALAGAVATGDEASVSAGCRACLDQGTATLWVDELLLQSTLIVGWPRALSALAIWRRHAGGVGGVGEDGGVGEVGEDGTDYGRAAVWRARGEAVCREVYGKNYARLRENVRALHPALEAWMVVEGYGRTLGRPGLDLARRELATVVQVAVQGAEQQLHAHLKGALNAGASRAAVAAALELSRPLLGSREAALAERVWQRVRA